MGKIIFSILDSLRDKIKRKRTFKPIPLRQGLMAIIKSSVLNVLLVFVPFGIISKLFGWSSTAIIVLNSLAIIPMARLLDFATDVLFIRVGEIPGVLLDISFGNAVEIIISIIALTKGLVIVVQNSMLGLILSHLILDTGLCFVLGGFKFHEQEFNAKLAQSSASFMAIATSSLLLPAAFVASASFSNVDAPILSISRSTAIILLFLYAGYIVFQFIPMDHYENDGQGINEEENIEQPATPIWMAITLLVLTTVLVAFCAEFLIGAIADIFKKWHLTETFIGLILLPIVSNSAEHVMAVKFAMKDKMDAAISASMGSSIQIALFVTPLTVIIGWGMNVPMTLYFNVYATAVMFISVLIANYLIADGKSNYFQGLMLLGLYLIIAISFAYYPDEQNIDP